MEKITCEVYRYEELSAEAKEKALEWYREEALPSLWGVVAENIRDGVEAGLDGAGITVEDGPYYDLYRREVGGEYRFSVDVNGEWHNGASALYEQYKVLAQGPDNTYAVHMRDLLAAALDLVDKAGDAGATTVRCVIEGERWISHSELEICDDEGRVVENSDEIDEAAVDLAREIHAFVLMFAETESEWAESEEYAKEFFEAGGYRFLRDGRPWGGC